MRILRALLHAFSMSFAMSWEILWALILGFTLSAMVQAVVSKREMTKLLPDDSPRSLLLACGLGAASSSCSYAAVALARSIFRKGADFTSAMAFELASTNLVIELGIILTILMGWQFTLAEFLGGFVMVFFLAFLFRIFLKPSRIQEAKEQADQNLPGSMEGHAAMDMSITEGSLGSRLFSSGGFTAISHYFMMDWAAIWKDIAGGLLLAGALAAWVPGIFWQKFFLVSHPILAKFWGPLIGPIVSMLSFVCSIGNVPLAAVLWNGGISFGGVLAFIYADLIIFPILNIYRKYYGAKMSFFILTTFFLSMTGAALVIEFLFQWLGIIPAYRNAQVVEPHVTWNYTTILNLVFLIAAAIFWIRFLKTNGMQMLRRMEMAPTAPEKEISGGSFYTCPMHPQVHEKEPDRCPTCHMQLVPKKEST